MRSLLWRARTCLLQAPAFHCGRLPVAATGPLPANARDERVAQTQTQVSGLRQRTGSKAEAVVVSASSRVNSALRQPLSEMFGRRESLRAAHGGSAARASMMRLRAAMNVSTVAEAMLFINGQAGPQ